MLRPSVAIQVTAPSNPAGAGSPEPQTTTASAPDDRSCGVSAASNVSSVLALSRVATMTVSGVTTVGEVTPIGLTDPSGPDTERNLPTSGSVVGGEQAYPSTQARSQLRVAVIATRSASAVEDGVQHGRREPEGPG